jgi:hypothetical protein
MEPEVRAFLARIVRSFSMALLWMIVNMIAGIYFDLGFIHNSISLVNIIYYIFFLSSLYALVWYLLKLWKQSLSQ